MHKTNRFNHDAIVVVQVFKPVERNKLWSVLRQLVKLELRIAPDHLPDKLLARLVDGERKVWLVCQSRPESYEQTGTVTIEPRLSPRPPRRPQNQPPVYQPVTGVK